MKPRALAIALRDNELLFEKLYIECTRLFPRFAHGFSQLAIEEKCHADLLSEIIEDITINSDAWRCANVSLKTVELVSEAVRETLKLVQSGEVAPRYVITQLRSMEQSMAERSVEKILLTDSPEMLTKMKQISEGFVDHLIFLQKLESTIFPKSDKEALFDV